MDDYTPSTEEVKTDYLNMQSFVADEKDIDANYRALMKFNRWLASVRADAWDEGYATRTEYERGIVAAYLDDADEYISAPANPYRSENN